MKTIKQILILVRQEIIDQTYFTTTTESKVYYGLCQVAGYLFKENKLTSFELNIFNQYWNTYAQTVKVFYRFKDDNVKGIVIKTLGNGWYHWIPRNKPPRINWLDRHIKLNP